MSGDWMMELIHSVGENVQFETVDGVFRTGRLSRVKLREMIWCKRVTSIPIEIEINGDPSDTIPLERLVKLNLLVDE